MPSHQFLSDEWFAAVEKVVADFDPESPTQADLVMNLVVTGTPFGEERQLHVGTRDGVGQWGFGHATDADLTVTTDYDTAREILLAGDPQVGLNAFMTGRVKIQGDLAKLLATMGAGEAPTGAVALAQAVLDITA